eukprot:SAG31_NODE_5593_length_2434_cov_1.981156_2_plen_155_part_00
MFLPAHVGAAVLLVRQGRVPGTALLVAAGLHVLTAVQQYRASERLRTTFAQLLGSAWEAEAKVQTTGQQSLTSMPRLGWPISFAQSAWLEHRGEVVVERNVSYGESGVHLRSEVHCYLVALLSWRLCLRLQGKALMFGGQAARLPQRLRLRGAH